MYTHSPATPITTMHGDLLVRRVRLSPEDSGEPATTYLHLVAWKGAPDSWINALELEEPDEDRLADMVDTTVGRQMLTRMAIVAGSGWELFEVDPITFLEHNQFCVDVLGGEGIEELMRREPEELVRIQAIERAEAPRPAVPALVAL